MATKRSGRRTFGSIRRLSSGRYQAHYTDPNGKRQTAPSTFDSKQAADRWLAQQQTELVRGSWLDPTAGRVTFAAFAEQWLAAPPRPLRESTRLNYRRFLDRYLLAELDGFRLGDFELQSITPAVVREFAARLQTAATRQPETAGGRQPHPARQWAAAVGLEVPATGRLPQSVLDSWRRAGSPVPTRTRTAGRKGEVVAEQTYRLLKTILNTAASDGAIASNPCRTVRVKAPAAPERQPATAEQVELLSRLCPPRYRVAVLLAAYSALRAGELFGLTRADVDTAAGTVTVSKQLAKLPGRAAAFAEPKTAKSLRTVHLPQRIVAELAEHLAEFTAPEPDALVFTTAGGEPCHKGNRQWFLAARRKAGLPALRWHDLRHTAQTFAAEQGVGLRALMNRMGHASPRAALIYIHASESADQQLAAKLDAVAVQAGKVTDLQAARLRRAAS